MAQRKDGAFVAGMQHTLVLHHMWFAVTLALTFFTWGEVFSLFPGTLSDWFGSRHATPNYAFLYTAKGVAAIVGGGVAATLARLTGEWGGVLYASSVLAVLSSLSALYLRARPVPRAP